MAMGRWLIAGFSTRLSFQCLVLQCMAAFAGQVLPKPTRGLKPQCVSIFLVCVLLSGHHSVAAQRGSVVVTLLDPFHGAVFRETNDIEISFSAEVVQPWPSAGVPTAVVSLTDYRDSAFEVMRGPMDSLEGSWGTGRVQESSFTVQGVPNGPYVLAVKIFKRGDGGAENLGE